jgi:hypothetical protein
MYYWNLYNEKMRQKYLVLHNKNTIKSIFLIKYLEYIFQVIIYIKSKISKK